eukprot:m51a1_g6252 hypothetical protein (311) ;mRNA; r:89346-90495
MHETSDAICLLPPQYEAELSTALATEDVLKAVQSGSRQIRWSQEPSAARGGAAGLAEYAWHARAKPLLVRALAAVLALLSACVLWSEATFSFDSPVLSVLALATVPEGVRRSTALLSAATAVPLAYIVACAYWSTLKLRLFSYYRLIPGRQTDANSILFSASLLCRLAAPLALNFVNMEKEVMKGMENMPLVGDRRFNELAPSLLLVLCALTLSNTATRCARFLHIRQFEYAEGFHDERMDEGRTIIAEQRRRQGRGGLASSSPLSSLPAVDLEAGGRSRAPREPSPLSSVQAAKALSDWARGLPAKPLP